MQKRKTQSSVGALSGLQGEFNFEQSPSSPRNPNYQHQMICRWQIDRNLLVTGIEVRHG